MHPTRIDELSVTIEELSSRIDQGIRPFARQIEHLLTIPFVKKITAQVIIAETCEDMTRFRTQPNQLPDRGLPRSRRVRRQTTLRQTRKR
jgi:hypothetical protein